MKSKFESILNAFNIFASLIIAVAALMISINSYQISVRQTDLEEGQLRLELKNSILELITTSSMLRQTEKDYPNIQKCIETFIEIKVILQSQLKNKTLFDNKILAEKWTSFLVDINFNIKFFQPGTSPNVLIDGAYKKIEDFENQSTELLRAYE